MWWIIGINLVVQVAFLIVQVAIVRDAVILAYRQLWREQMAAIMLHEKSLEKTPPAQESGVVQ